MTPDDKSQRGYGTNLASEFYVLSAFYRLGLDAKLTLGNKKGFAIVVRVRQARQALLRSRPSREKTIGWLVS